MGLNFWALHHADRGRGSSGCLGASIDMWCEDGYMSHYLPTNVIPAEAGCEADIPADWPGLWLQLLKAREGSLEGAMRYSEAAGLELFGPVSPRAATLFRLYKPLLDARWQQHSHPNFPAWVLGQLGQSLDGFIATTTGDSFFVSGEHCLLHLHRLRALCDAVIVGAGTVAMDNPQLTTRRVPGHQPVRVVLDPAARLDGKARVFRDAQAQTLWVCDAQHAHVAHSRLHAAHHDTCEVLPIEGLIATNNMVAPYRPRQVVQALAQRGLRLLFVEGGGVTVSRFFAAGALDRLHLAVAPVLIGQGRRGLQVPSHEVMADCLRPQVRTLALGTDILWDMDLRPQAV